MGNRSGVGCPGGRGVGDQLLDLPRQHRGQPLPSQLDQCFMDGRTLAMRRRKARRISGFT
ncbi:hypothetical protein CVE34_10215 [Pseudomonas syringae pv. actinidiae]|nr:hypothetical protein IYO_015775 [Pseudomonas syringae pv. actinidiae ICMP 18884]AOE57355.1 hypothetical protein NZ708_15755 [Pseudomonas syringae pv. actinidiae ICMP 18708]APP98312.1 hypothetical protein PsaNZ45_16305 [Pseudomonas syringae pv. actinidiae]APQ04069.1 hypothetical protein PsaNZ47_15750 [Pseudomonas syringae pv. actinidiae]NAS64812.1 hypothetical protein [Pseudomonas syringae pv. actinidiae]